MLTPRTSHVLVGLLAAAALAAVPACGDSPELEPADGGAPAGPNRPHVILVVADDMGWGDVGYHGGAIQTANLDRLAGAGVRLEQFYVMPACSPTRAALLTGRSPVRYGMTSVVRLWEDFGLPGEEVTLAELFRAAGYETAMAGKWHLGHRRREFLPNEQGFDSFYGMLGAWIDYTAHAHDGMRDWQRDGRSLNEQGWSTDLLVEEAVRRIRSPRDGRPLFLYLPFNAPHAPAAAPPALVRRYRDLAEPEEVGDVGPADELGEAAEEEPAEAFDERARHAAAVHAMDDGIGRIVRALERAGMAEDTLLCFLSDNGSARGHGSNGSLRGGKLGAYEGAVRVPCFVTWPRGLAGGGALEEVTSVVDLLPTLTAAAGVERFGPVVDGEDLLPYLRGEQELASRELFLCVGRKDVDHWVLRRGPWKLQERTSTADGSVERRLYRLDLDPEEQVDVAAENPERVAELAERLRAWQALSPPDVQRSFVKPKGWKQPADMVDLLEPR